MSKALINPKGTCFVTPISTRLSPVSICGGDIGEVTHTPHFCKIKSTKVPECTQCTMEVTRYTAKAKFKSTSELLITLCHLVLIYKGGNTKISTFLPKNESMRAKSILNATQSYITNDSKKE